VFILALQKRENYQILFLGFVLSACLKRTSPETDYNKSGKRAAV
jgi:hypothetical protein